MKLSEEYRRMFFWIAVALVLALLQQELHIEWKTS